MDRDVVATRLLRAWDRAWFVVPWLLAAMALSLFWSHATPHMCYGGYWL